MKIFKSFVIRFLVILLAVQGAVASQLLTLTSVQAADHTPEVVINEVMWMGSTATSGAEDEWVELFNPATEPSVDLSGWILTNVRTAGAGNNYTIPIGTELAVGEYLLIGQSGLGSTIRSVPLDLGVSSFSLSNPPSCRAIELKNLLDISIDSMGCNPGGTYFGGENTATKRSLERDVMIADGTMSASWHSSVGYVNLSDDAWPNNFATPKFINDETAAISGVVNDGLTTDVYWSNSLTAIDVNWSGFTDPESDVVAYAVGLGTTPSTDDVVALTDVGLDVSANLTFDGVENTRYYSLVITLNGAGIVSEIKSSDGFTINTIAPAAPTSVVVTDVPSDNGGSVKVGWNASSSPDVVNYLVNYRKVGSTIWVNTSVGVAAEKVISGLENTPVTYEFTVTAVDFSNLTGTSSPIVTGQALDNLVPVINPAKVIIDQNRPGTADVVRGLSFVSNEPGQYFLFDRVPTDPAKITLGSGVLDATLGFPGIGIGDNANAAVWLVVHDQGDNPSLPLKLTNDIVGPNAPVLNKVVSNCVSDTCRVTLEWQAGSADTVSYKVIYTVDGVDSQTFEVSTTSMAMDLASGKSYLFKVVGYDGAGNPSMPSNVFSLALTKGVKTTAIFNNGAVITTTEAISGSLAVKNVVVSTSKTSPAQFVPKAKAAEPVVSTPSESTPPLVAGAENSSDWVRILVVVVLLLIIAGSFYALSRSVRETPEEEFDKKKKEDKASETKKRRRHRRNRR